jgi:cytosine/creatinine deaminase
MALDATDVRLLDAAVEQARIGLAEGGIPIGAAVGLDGEVIGVGRNRRIQQGSAILHAETDALERAGLRSAEEYARATMYTTLSPCPMCSGAMLYHGMRRIVIGEHRTKVGEEALLASRGVEVLVADRDDCVEILGQFIAAQPEVWGRIAGTQPPATS